MVTLCQKKSHQSLRPAIGENVSFNKKVLRIGGRLGGVIDACPELLTFCPTVFSVQCGRTLDEKYQAENSMEANESE